MTLSILSICSSLLILFCHKQTYMSSRLVFTQPLPKWPTPTKPTCLQGWFLHSLYHNGPLQPNLHVFKVGFYTASTIMAHSNQTYMSSRLVFSQPLSQWPTPTKPTCLQGWFLHSLYQNGQLQPNMYTSTNKKPIGKCSKIPS